MHLDREDHQPDKSSHYQAYQRSMCELDEALSEEELSGIECHEGVAQGNEGTGEPDVRRWREIPF